VTDRTAEYRPEITLALAVASVDPHVAAALEQLRAGGMIVLEGTWNGSTLGLVVQATSHVTQSSIAFMARHAGGIVCVPLTAERTDALALRRTRPTSGDSALRLPFTVTVEARDGVSTGISAADRARTVQVLGDPETQAEELVQPGHVVPVRVDDETRGWPAVVVELASLVDLSSALAVCHVLDEDGAVADQSAVRRFAADHQLPLLTGADVADRARRNRRVLTAEAAPSIRHRDRSFSVVGYRDGQRRHYALVLGEPAKGVPVVRVHVQRPVDDAFGSTRAALVGSLDAIAEAEVGVLVYLADDGARGGAERLWSLPYTASEILTDLGVRALRDGGA
jgi:3,4-dihydroxy 2-butanone 4-phosphate synthase / GTP cyclohydrolase II